MKLIAAFVVAIAIVASTATGLALVAKVQSHRVEAAEPCVGLECWPPSSPVKHRPAQRATLQPVW
jgi:hypothetical protein